MPIITKYYPRFPGQERKVRERYVVDENGVKQGLYQSYYRDGQDKVTCTYKDDVQHGHYISKHPNGRMAMECDYDEGALEGRVVRQDPKGMLLFDGHYHRNLDEGTQKYYQADGKLHVLENWHLGTREGKSVTWMYDRIETVVFKNNEAVCMPQCFVGGTSKMSWNFPIMSL